MYIWQKQNFSKKTVDKHLLSEFSDISKELNKLPYLSTQDEKQAIVDKHIDKVFTKMKPKRCTHEFSTPAVALEALEIMKADEHNFAELVLMKKVNKLNADLQPLASKKTGKPTMHWVPFYEEITQQTAA